MNLRNALTLWAALAAAASLWGQVGTPTISPASLPDGFTGVAYSQALTSNVSGTFVSGNPAIPTWLTLTQTGPFSASLRGTPPNTVTPYPFAINLLNPLTGSVIASRSYTLFVWNPLVITTTSPLPSGTLNAAYSATLQATGGTPITGGPSYTWVVLGNLPAGLTLNSTTGQLSGTPTAAGTFSFNIQVTDSRANSATKAFSLTIFNPNAGLAITTNSPLPPGTEGAPYSPPVTFTAVGGRTPYTFSLLGTGLPPGLALASSGLLSGTPSKQGVYRFTVQVRDSANASATKGFILTINPTSGPTILTIVSTALPDGVVGQPYSATLEATGGTEPYFWNIDGSLPPGLSLDSSAGVISGTPTQSFTANFLASVKDSAGAADQQNLSISVAGPPGGLIPSSLSLFFRSIVGLAPPPQFVSIVASDNNTTPFSMLVEQGRTPSGQRWIVARPPRGTTPARIQVNIDPTGLPPGRWTGRLSITGANATITVDVTLDLLETLPGAGDPEVSPDSLRFAGSRAGVSGDVQTLLLTSGTPLRFTATVRRAPWLRVLPANGLVALNQPAVLRVSVLPDTVADGSYRGSIVVDWGSGSQEIPVSLVVARPGLYLRLSNDGLRFEARAGGGNTATRTFGINALGIGTLNWQGAILAGADWLSLDRRSGAVASGDEDRPRLRADPSALAPGNYYGLVRISDPNALNSPQYLLVVFPVGDPLAPPRPDLSPGGFFFNGARDPQQSQALSLFVSSQTPVPFQASANMDDGGNWLTVAPTKGSASSGSPAQLSVIIDTSGLKAGVYTGDIVVAFSSSFIRTAGVTLIVPPTSANAAAAEPRDAGCAPARLVVATTGTVNSFTAPTGWPTPLAVRVADDCANAVANAQVVATFSNGDPAVTLRATNNSTGTYSGTWTPRNQAASVTVTARATSATLVAAEREIIGAVSQNRAPGLSHNGIIHNLNPLVGGPLAPGTVAQVYGSDLASDTVSPNVLPLAKQYNGTRVLVAGSEAPLYFLSSGQLNVQLPSELPGEGEVQVVVSTPSGITQPETVSLTKVTPGVAAFGDGRVIAQKGVDYSLITPENPARPGDPIIIYLVGMGVTNPLVPTGQASPVDPLPWAAVQPVVTVDGRPATLYYAGLTPGLAGLYQINLQVPLDSPTGTLKVVVTQGDVAANETTLPVRR